MEVSLLDAKQALGKHAGEPASECSCHPAWDEDTPPCWPCYRAGFDTPNPNAERDD